MANYFSGQDAKVVHVAQTTFGTDPSMATAGTIKGTSAFDISHDLNVREGDQVTGTRWRVDGDVRTDQNEAMPTIGEDVVVFKANFSDQLYAHFQSVTEEATTPYKKTFVYHATQPDFTTNAGFFETLVLENPDGNQTDVVFKDVITQEMTATVEPRGELQLSLSHVSRGSGSASLSYVGNTTRAVTDTYAFTGLTDHHFNGVAFNPIGPIEVTSTQTITGVGVDAAGDGRFQTYLLTDKKATFKAKINFDKVARDMKFNFVNDRPVTMLLGWGTSGRQFTTPVGSVDGDLNFSGSIKLTSWQEDLSQAYAVDIEGEFLGSQTKSPLEVIFADGVDHAY